MGLESLFLEANYELKFRLKQRITKLFSLLDYDPYMVRNVISKAYDVRSQFVHGGQLSYKKLNNQFGDIRSFLRLLLDYLRVSILAFKFAPIGKDEMLDLIDEASFDKAKETRLINILSASKSLIKAP